MNMKLTNIIIKHNDIDMIKSDVVNMLLKTNTMSLVVTSRLCVMRLNAYAISTPMSLARFKTTKKFGTMPSVIAGYAMQLGMLALKISHLSLSTATIRWNTLIG